MRGKKPTASKTDGDLLPAMPRGMDKFAKHMWKLVLRERGPWLDLADAPALTALSEAWSLRCRSAEILADDPTDNKARIAFCQYSQVFERMLTRFGLSPIDRERLGCVAVEGVRRRQSDPPAAEFIR